MPKTKASDDFDYNTPTNESDITNNADMTAEVDLDIDLTTIKGVELLPDGEYVFVLEKATPGRSQNGNLKVTLQLSVAEGDRKGHKHFEDLTLVSGYAGEMALQALQALGVPRAFKGNLGQELASKVGTRILSRVSTQKNTTQRDKDGNLYPDKNRLNNIRAAASF